MKFGNIIKAKPRQGLNDTLLFFIIEDKQDTHIVIVLDRYEKSLELTKWFIEESFEIASILECYD